MYDNLLFYSAYEDFYRMAATSPAFAAYCRDAFGEDFSQDGFSDLWQIRQILPCIPARDDVHILDIGCGNGKMLGYLQRQTGAFIHGFDYSTEAIGTARRLFPFRSDFQVGLIGQTNYPDACFDTVISMDTLYFAPDMSRLVAQVKRWLKPGGIFFAGYQEGDVIPKTDSWAHSLLAKALSANGLNGQAQDITHQTWMLLQKKRKAALLHQNAFMQEDLGRWFDMLMAQTACAAGSFESFSQQFARYLVIVQKQ